MTMLRSIFVVSVTIVALGSTAPGVARSVRHAPKGHLLIIGGNGTTDDIMKRAVETAGGPAGRVVVFPQASELADAADNALKMWTGAGVGRAVAADVKKPEEAIALVKQATFVWFPGGDQTRLMKALEGTGILEAIRARYEAGALVGGTSAGAAVMSRVMITGDAFDLQSITAAKTDTRSGIGLFPAAIVDQHFLKRQRMNRLISAVLDHPDLVGIGIDETTAIFVTGTRFEVLGKSSVVVIDARKAAVDRTPADQLATGRNLRLSVLKAGQTFRIEN
jgi:cyanophycinase